MEHKRLVLDANILIRAYFGRRVRCLFTNFAEKADFYVAQAALTEARIRDPEDWPTLALSLQLECAVWTEDQDFFGTGVATWTCATVERFFGQLKGIRFAIEQPRANGNTRTR